jgi:hypothetical protein
MQLAATPRNHKATTKRRPPQFLVQTYHSDHNNNVVAVVSKPRERRRRISLQTKIHFLCENRVDDAGVPLNATTENKA